MKNIKRCAGILGIILVFVLLISACNSNQGGALTITDIPSSFNGKYAVLEGYNRSFFVLGAQRIDSETGNGTGARISNGRVIIPVWLLDEEGITGYVGNHTLDIDITILDSPSTDDWDSIAWIDFESITFTNGNARVSFRDAVYFEE